MKKLFIVWWWDIKKFETLSLDKVNLESAGKLKPKVLFIPTASSESESYIDVFTKTYQEKLWWVVEVLFLLKDKLSKQEIEKKILSSDLIYVGWGNTLKMMKKWRLLWVDEILRKAYEKGIVCSWASAGWICWFSSWHSDSMSFYKPDDWKYINVKWLWIIDAIHCPHFDSGTTMSWEVKFRKDLFEKFMRKYTWKIAIALDDCCAISIIDDKYKIVSSKPWAKAYKIYWERWVYHKYEIEQFDKYLPLSQILTK